MALKHIAKHGKHPCKLATDLSLAELQELVDDIQDILWVEVESRGDMWDPDKLEHVREWTTGDGQPPGIGMLEAIMRKMKLAGLKPATTECKR